MFRLLGEGKRFAFSPTWSDAPEYAGSSTGGLAQPTNEDINPPSRQQEKRLKTRLSPEALQKRLFDIGTTPARSRKSKVSTSLYLSLGLLKWFEDDKSDVERCAPLVLLPVRLERSSAADRFYLASRSEPPSPNLSLQAKMDGEFGLSIEDFGNEGRCRHHHLSGRRRTDRLGKSRWEVQPDAMVLGFFSYSKFLMYRDLDPENWPTDGGLDQHPLIAGLLQDGFEALRAIVADDGKIDSIIPLSPPTT